MRGRSTKHGDGGQTEGDAGAPGGLELQADYSQCTMTGMQQKIKSIAAVLVGLFFFGFAILYFTVPASSLPHSVPGYLADSPRIHFKPGLGSLLLALGAFVYAWFSGGRSSK